MSEEGKANQARLHAFVEGRVQGVGFRFFVVDLAYALGLRGWVRNTYDGQVEVLAEGEREALERLLAELHRGPRSAYVTDVKATWEPASGEFIDFRVRPTS